jgi:hypothetical protein
MKTRLMIQFSGWHENGQKTEKKFTILNIEEEVTMEIIIKELQKDSLLSPFRRNKDIEIHSMQPF